MQRHYVQLIVLVYAAARAQITRCRCERADLARLVADVCAPQSPLDPALGLAELEGGIDLLVLLWEQGGPPPEE